ncbi:MAG: helicase-associated domain-containing protein [Chloroflexi bacterium]|nr:helicase-associated domain-containing protein [Chloroflexota bacterium]
MPDLEHIYLDLDLALLHAIAAQAGVQLAAPNARAAAAELAAALRQSESVEILLARALSDEARLALHTLQQAGGQFAVAPFVRRFGDLRPLGSAALAREHPWDAPGNATEALYFNGLIGRGFMETDTGPQEFFFIPSDLLPNLPPAPSQLVPSAAATATPSAEPVGASLATSALVDDSVTVLAAIQRQPGQAPAPETVASHLRLPSLNFLLTLLDDLGLTIAEFRLNRDRARAYLQGARGEQLRALADAWRDSRTCNDLWCVPTLRPQTAGWANDPVAARAHILRLCADLPPGQWRTLDSFIAFVREHHPDFQRPAGDYDSWYIRDAVSGDYLHGFEHWEQVDGALVRYLITGPMHWLGLADISPEAFRLTALFPAFMGQAEWRILDKPKPLTLHPDGLLVVPRSANRYDRFQAARIGEWLAPKEKDTYAYLITGGSLQAALAQGITARHIVAFLRRACAAPMPQMVVEAVERWGRNGVEIRAATTLVLRVKDRPLLDFLRHSPKTGPHLGESLGDLAVEVKNWEKLQDGLMELGMVAEVKTANL